MLIQKQCKKITFTGNLEQDENTKLLFIIEETEETILDFSQVR